eukprot:m.169420 g.169420  ORF g.169420 m.169420 type:complete len:104 (-) comp16475_c0_seq4:91-402(-)
MSVRCGDADYQDLLKETYKTKKACLSVSATNNLRPHNLQVLAVDEPRERAERVLGPLGGAGCTMGEFLNIKLNVCSRLTTSRFSLSFSAAMALKQSKEQIERS